MNHNLTALVHDNLYISFLASSLSLSKFVFKGWMCGSLERVGKGMTKRGLDLNDDKPPVAADRLI